MGDISHKDLVRAVSSSDLDMLLLCGQNTIGVKRGLPSYQGQWVAASDQTLPVFENGW